MKKNIAIYILLYPCLVFANSALNDAKTMVNRIYTNIDKTVYDKVEMLTRDDYIDMYGLDKNGEPLYTAQKYANDIIFINGGKGEPFIGPELYFGEIEEFVNSNDNVDFKYEIDNIKSMKQPELRKNEDEPDFAEVSVKKEWIVDGDTYRINDKLIVNLKHRHIATISNEYVSLKDSPEVTMDGMLAKATALYNSDKFEEAVNFYKKIISKYPNCDEAWYYLGVMYFKMQGVGHLTNKLRLQKAYDCWKHSNLKKAHSAISYITDGRE